MKAAFRMAGRPLNRLSVLCCGEQTASSTAVVSELGDGFAFSSRRLPGSGRDGWVHMSQGHRPPTRSFSYLDMTQHMGAWFSAQRQSHLERDFLDLGRRQRHPVAPLGRVGSGAATPAAGVSMRVGWAARTFDALETYPRLCFPSFPCHCAKPFHFIVFTALFRT